MECTRSDQEPCDDLLMSEPDLAVLIALFYPKADKLGRFAPIPGPDVPEGRVPAVCVLPDAWLDWAAPGVVPGLADRAAWGVSAPGVAVLELPPPHAASVVKVAARRRSGMPCRRIIR